MPFYIYYQAARNWGWSFDMTAACPTPLLDWLFLYADIEGQLQNAANAEAMRGIKQ